MTSEYMLCILPHALPKYPVHSHSFYIPGVYTTMFEKIQDLQKESSIHTHFTFQQMNFNLLVMSFTSRPTAIISKIGISQENKIKKKKNQHCGQEPYQFSCLLLFVKILFLLQPSTRLDGPTCPFTQCKGIKTNNNREKQTNKQNPPKLLASCLNQLRMPLYVPASTCGVS